ncbi:hypothetical protein Mal64_37280 [Pseudobythopirellula maris]|uniref:PSP1 C-terminal domain-containing protein n=1 Tax=Pseudobythopirellula maris TaxID=2527991 RepID=A0A5C5ZI86_9BACT|nr:PSP1 C-terminal domain-containing protein [Pseudobythopirellula maris]TWT86898.1 hypothetical protein Mal64_37280 [Pseudobythopirellula maris]
MTHLVRIGAFGRVGRFRSADAVRYAAGDRVIVRTERGLETGEVLTADDGLGRSTLSESGAAEPDGALLRRMTTEDDLLAARVAKNRDAAYAACVELIESRGLDAVLVDVEHLFDGASLWFHFLGPTPPEVEALTAELAEAYESRAQFRQFTETLEEGCGPGCGTAEATGGGGCSTCAGCAVASACSTK